MRVHTSYWCTCMFAFTDSDEIIVQGVRMRAFDMGGQTAARRIWPDYYADLSGIVFMVDSSDTERLEEAKNELTVSVMHSCRKLNVVLIVHPVLTTGTAGDRVVGKGPHSRVWQQDR